MPQDFESFLTDQRDQATQPAAPAAPPDFESFMRQAKGEQDGSVLQSAQATTVVNAQQGSATATAAAPVARQLGLPQPAVEADLPRFQQQAKVQQNTALLSSNPVLARWVAANPDSARVAQDEYHQLASIEQIFSAGADSLGGVGYAGLQSLASSFNSGALGLNRQIANLSRLLGPDAAGAVQSGIVRPLEGDQTLLRVPEANIGQKAVGVVGNLLGLLSQITLTGGMGEAGKVASTVGEFLTTAGQTAAKAMAFPSLTAATNKGADVYEKTGSQSAATKAALAEYLFTTTQGLVPFSAPGGLATRALTGAASGLGTSEGQRGAMNLLLPSELHQGFDPQEALFQAVSGAVLGGAMGPHAEPNFMPAIRQTYVDALKAEQAERDIGKVAALGQISAQSKLREADPQAFRKFVETVSDSTKLDAVYVNAREMADALQQSGVDLSTAMPDLAHQIGEGVLTGGDVRIPVADFATHIAGTDLEKALIPNMKAAPDGMTFKEGQAFYQDAAKNMEAKAKEIADGQQQTADAEGDKQTVADTMLAQLKATGRYPDSVAKANATLVSEFYGTQAERMGMTAGELYKQMPLKVGAEGTGGLEQGAITKTPEFKKWFGESKVVDDKGEPLVVYHGTMTPGFDTFKRGEVQPIGGVRFADAQGFYFTDHAGYAADYGDTVMPAYLSIKKPFIVPADQYDHAYVTAERRAELEAQGYDGIIAPEVEGGRYGEIVVFKPEQIKSAIGNAGTFDPKDPNILKQADAKPTPEEQRATIDLRKRESILQSLAECLGAA